MRELSSDYLKNKNLSERPKPKNLNEMLILEISCNSLFRLWVLFFAECKCTKPDQD